jgi:hypothetical protein
MNVLPKTYMPQVVSTHVCNASTVALQLVPIPGRVSYGLVTNAIEKFENGKLPAGQHSGVESVSELHM